MPFSNPLSLGTIGLKARDLPWFAFEQADVVICIGYDMVEYHPDMWNPKGDKTIIHVDALPAEVDAHYIVACGVLGDISSSLRGIAVKARPQSKVPFKAVRRAIQDDRASFAEDTSFPVKPQKIVWDLREALAPDDIVISNERSGWGTASWVAQCHGRTFACSAVQGSTTCTPLVQGSPSGPPKE